MESQFVDKIHGLSVLFSLLVNGKFSTRGFVYNCPVYVASNVIIEFASSQIAVPDPLGCGFGRCSVFHVVLSQILYMC